MNRTLSGVTIPEQIITVTNSNEGLLCIPQNSIITGTSPSDSLVSYTGHSLSVSYSSAEVQLVHSTAPADRERFYLVVFYGVYTFVGYEIKISSIRIYIYIYIYI